MFTSTDGRDPKKKPTTAETKASASARARAEGKAAWDKRVAALSASGGDVGDEAMRKKAERDAEQLEWQKGEPARSERERLHKEELANAKPFADKWLALSETTRACVRLSTKADTDQNVSSLLLKLAHAIADESTATTVTPATELALLYRVFTASK